MEEWYLLYRNRGCKEEKGRQGRKREKRRKREWKGRKAREVAGGPERDRERDEFSRTEGHKPPD